MLQTLFAALFSAATLSLSALPAHGSQADLGLEPLAATAPPGAVVQSYGPSDWFGGGELLTWEVQQFPGELESIHLAIAIEGESSFTLQATGGTMHLDWAGVGVRVWTPRELRDFLAASPGPITASRLGRDEPWADETTNPLTDPDLELVGYSAFCWPLGAWNRTGIGTPPQGMHARWPTADVPWTTHVDTDRQTAVAFHLITDPAQLAAFEGNGTAILTLAPLRDWQVTQVTPPFVSYIPIDFRRRIEGITLIQVPSQAARAEPAEPEVPVWHENDDETSTMLAQQTTTPEVETLGFSDVSVYPVLHHFDKFDPALGTLLDVQVSVKSTELMSAFGENTSPAPTTLSWTGGWAVDLVVGGSVAYGGSMGNSEHELEWEAGAYDGTIDYAGTSGISRNHALEYDSGWFSAPAGDVASWVASSSPVQEKRDVEMDVTPVAGTYDCGLTGNCWIGATRQYAHRVSVRFVYDDETCVRTLQGRSH